MLNVRLHVASPIEGEKSIADVLVIGLPFVGSYQPFILSRIANNICLPCQ